LPGLKARIKLALLISDGRNPEQVRAAFEGS